MKQQFSPGVPTRPSGVKTGQTDEEYVFSTSSEDLDGDRIKYGWDWGDGSSIEWTDFYESGEICEVTHSWNKTGYYLVRAIAMDENGFYNVYHILSDVPHMDQWSDGFSIKIYKSKRFIDLFNVELFNKILNINNIMKKLSNYDIFL
jgi:hypothetical protein